MAARKLSNDDCATFRFLAERRCNGRSQRILPYDEAHVAFLLFPLVSVAATGFDRTVVAPDTSPFQRDLFTLDLGPKLDRVSGLAGSGAAAMRRQSTSIRSQFLFDAVGDPGPQSLPSLQPLFLFSGLSAF